METKQARAWLSANGYRVKPKGRIPADLLAIYQAKDKRDATSPLPVPEVSEKRKRSSCGFCTVNAPHKHKHCPESINQGKMGIWICLCYERGHV